MSAEKFDTLVNFRDLGDYTNRDGRKIKRGRLLRCGELFELPDHEAALLENEYNVKQVVDLRRDEEVQKKPNRELVGSTYHNLDLFKSNGENAPSQQNLSAFDVNSGENATEHMKEVYEVIIHSEQSQQGLLEFLNILADNKEGATLWHCFAGKDRTGVTAMLILHLLDVDKEVIFEDFLRTNELRAEANEKLIDELRAQGITKEQEQNHYILLNVDRAYLEKAYEIMERDYGSVDNYIFDTLGFDRSKKEILHELYLD